LTSRQVLVKGSPAGILVPSGMVRSKGVPMPARLHAASVVGVAASVGVRAIVAITVGSGVLVAVGSGSGVALGSAVRVSAAACVTSKTEVCINCSRLGVGGTDAGPCAFEAHAETIPSKTSRITNLR